eukprot:Clim_evm10s235 gene=Clim_evmTU10s235
MPRITGLGDYRNDEDKGPDEGDRGNEYYAGGSENSGQAILGPDRAGSGQNRDDVIRRVFEAARNQGAEEVAQDFAQNRPAQAKNVFRGAGMRLGTGNEASEVVDNKPLEEAGGSSEPAKITLTFWANGFSIDDGPLRALDDPENAEFLQSIHRGEIPQELVERSAQTGQIGVDLVDRRQEPYRQEQKSRPVGPRAVFTGQGHMLGSPTPGVVGNKTESSSDPAASTTTTTTTTTTATASIAASAESNAAAAADVTTSLQVRLHDGTRMIGRFTETQTVGDVRAFVSAARQLPEGKSFKLMSAFPPKELTDDNVTLKDAGLIGASVVQRLI